MEHDVQEGSLFSEWLNSINMRYMIVIKNKNMDDYGKEKVIHF